MTTQTTQRITVDTSTAVLSGLRRGSDLSPYSELRQTGDFRILELLPGEFDDPIYCTAETCSLLDEQPEYETVSYTWGHVPAEIEILQNEAIVNVTPNLQEGLRRFRLPDRPRKLWIDQLCIKQWDMKEKASQVGMMRRIYKHCTRCLIWLGEVDPEAQISPEDVEELFAHWRTLADPPEIGHKPRIWTPEGEGVRRALEWIMRNPWWKRVWTVQEAVLPSTALVMWGQHSIELKTMSAAATQLCNTEALEKANIRILLPEEEHLDLNNSFTMPVVGLGIAKDGEVSLRTLHRWRYRHATDPRDKVYALVGLMGRESNVYVDTSSEDSYEENNGSSSLKIETPVSDSGEAKQSDIREQAKTEDESGLRLAKLEIKEEEFDVQNEDLDAKDEKSGIEGNDESEEEVDEDDESDQSEQRSPYAWEECSYTIDPAKLYARVTVDLIRESKDLQPLMAGREAHVTPGLPTWAYDLEYQRRIVPYGGWEQIIGYWKYRATKDTAPDMEFFPEVGMIRLKGYMLDKIEIINKGLGENTWKTLDDNVHFAKCMEWKQNLTNWRKRRGSGDSYVGGGSIYHAFAATVVGDVMTDDEFPRWKADEEDYERVHEYLDKKDFSFEYINRAVRFSLIERSFFITEKGYLGFGNETIQSGDQVWLFYGSNMPFILRPVGKRFTFVKEAYVHGIMNGESVEQVSEEEIRWIEII